MLIILYFSSSYNLDTPSTRNEKLDHQQFISCSYLYADNDFRHVAFVLVSNAIDFSFLIFPEAIDSIAELVELCMVACLCSFSDEVGMEEIIHQDRELYSELYFIINYIIRYTFGEKRVETKTNFRGPAFYVRYKEYLPKRLKKAVTDFFRLQLLKADKGNTILYILYYNIYNIIFVYR